MCVSWPCSWPSVWWLGTRHAVSPSDCDVCAVADIADLRSARQSHAGLGHHAVAVCTERFGEHLGFLENFLKWPRWISCVLCHRQARCNLAVKTETWVRDVGCASGDGSWVPLAGSCECHPRSCGLCCCTRTAPCDKKRPRPVIIE